MMQGETDPHKHLMCGRATGAPVTTVLDLVRQDGSDGENVMEWLRWRMIQVHDGRRCRGMAVAGW